MAPNPIILYVTILATLCIKGLSSHNRVSSSYHLADTATPLWSHFLPVEQQLRNDADESSTVPLTDSENLYPNLLD